jgi:hypothetical protein
MTGSTCTRSTGNNNFFFFTLQQGLSSSSSSSSSSSLLMMRLNSRPAVRRKIVWPAAFHSGVQRFTRSIAHVVDGYSSMYLYDR